MYKSGDIVGIFTSEDWSNEPKSFRLLERADEPETWYAENYDYGVIVVSEQDFIK